MPRFMITYLGGNPPSTAEEGQKNFAEFRDWLSDLGDAVVSPANPIRNTHTVKPDGSTSSASLTAMSGFTIIEADTMEDALGHTRSCPFLKTGGYLEVSEIIKLGGL